MSAGGGAAGRPVAWVSLQSQPTHSIPGQALGDSAYLAKPSFKEMLQLILTQDTSNTVNHWGESELTRCFCKTYLN